MVYKFSEDALNLIYSLKLENKEDFSKLVNAYSKIKILNGNDERTEVLIMIWEKEFNSLIEPYLKDNKVESKQNYQSPIGNDLSKLNVTQKPDPALGDFLNNKTNKNNIENKINLDNQPNIQKQNEQTLINDKNQLLSEVEWTENLDSFLQEVDLVQKDFSSSIVNKESKSKNSVVLQPTVKETASIVTQNSIDLQKYDSELVSIKHKLKLEKTIEFNDKLISSLKEEIKSQKILAKQQRKESKLQKKLNKIKNKK